MPAVTVEFAVEHAKEVTPPYANGVTLTSLRDFWKIVDMGFPETRGVGKGKPLGNAEIRCSESDPRVDAILKIFAKHGYFPAKNVAKFGSNEFTIIRRRTYRPDEIAEAELLRAHPNFPYFTMADWIPGGNDETGWTGEANARLKKKLSFGHFDSLEVMLFSAELKERLEAERLAGLTFVPIRYDKPSRAARQLWQVAQNTKMPPCLLPRFTQLAEPFTEESRDGAFWLESGGYCPVELRFHRREVAAMGEFDVATTREKAGANFNMMHTDVIVSHRFRQVMADAKVKGIEYFPVRLVD
jgi:hypothetical protein